MSWQLDVTVAGDSILIEIRERNHRRQISNMVVVEGRPYRGRRMSQPLPLGRLCAVGERAAAGSSRVELVPFRPNHVDSVYAPLLLRYLLMVGRDVVYPGWRNVLRGGRPRLSLRYPEWAKLQRDERRAFIRACAVGIPASEIRINDATAVRRPLLRQLLNLRPVVDLDA